MKIVFKNLEHSDLVKNVVEERFAPLAEKFPYLNNHRVTVTLEMENSPVKAGRDSFSVRVLVEGKRYRGLNFSRRSTNLYVAVADTVDGMLELLNRAGERHRVRSRHLTRRMLSRHRQQMSLAA